MPLKLSSRELFVKRSGKPFSGMATRGQGAEAAPQHRLKHPVHPPRLWAVPPEAGAVLCGGAEAQGAEQAALAPCSIMWDVCLLSGTQAQMRELRTVRHR